MSCARGSRGQQEFKSPGRCLGSSAVPGLITQGRHTGKCTLSFFWSGWCLRSCSAVTAWAGNGEKNPNFCCKKHGEILFFQRGKMCLNWKTKTKFSCACISVKGELRVNRFVLFVGFWGGIDHEMLRALSVHCPPVWNCPALRNCPKFCLFPLLGCSIAGTGVWGYLSLGLCEPGNGNTSWARVGS